MSRSSPSYETVLITGASSGIGRELAHCFAQGGSGCLLLARSEEALHDLAEELSSTYDVPTSVLCVDLSRVGAAEDVVAEVEERGLEVDVLVNNAGVGAQGAFTDLDTGRQMDMLRLNVTALTHLSRLLLPGMLERGRGGLLNVASTAGFQPGPFMSVYYASKAYVLAFSEGLHEEVADTNVTVTCLAPGPTRTTFSKRADASNVRLFEMGMTMTPEAVAKTGFDAFRRGRALVVPGWSNKIGAFMVRWVPRPVARKMVGWLNR